MITIGTVAKGRGLEIDFRRPDIIQEKSKKSLALYDQESEPYVISEIVKQIIRERLFENSIDLSQLENFTVLGHHDWILFKNCFDTQHIPSTPVNDCPPENESWKIPAAILMGLLSLTGHKVASYKGEMNGRLAHMVMPAKNNELYKIRSTKQLTPHTEVVNGLWPEEIQSNTSNNCITPGVVGLASIRNPSHCATRVWYLDDILNKLPYSVIKDLMRCEYVTSSQSSFDVSHSLERVCVISEFHNLLSIRFSYTKLAGMTHRAKEALTKLKEYLQDEKMVERLVLKPGQVLILNNRSLLHGRDSLLKQALYDGNDRWLIRMYGFSYDGWQKLPKNEVLQHVATL